MLELWGGGVAFPGGGLGPRPRVFYFAREKGPHLVRLHGFFARCRSFCLFFWPLAHFLYGELWGKEAHLPWAVIFPSGGDTPRHPSQLYEAGLEGILLFLVLSFLFWKTKARYEPGKLVGTFLLGYGLCRFVVEFFRESDL